MRSKYLFKKSFLFFFLFFALSFESAFSVADWTMLIYAQAKNNLNKFAAKNLQDMSVIGSNSNLNMLVQWYQPGKNGVWRYCIKKNKVELESHIPINTDGNRVKDLVDSMYWAVSKYPAKKYILVLWNHGFGILDPIWKGRRGNSHNLYPCYNPRAEIDGIAIEDLLSRAILFNESSRTYMNNQQLVAALGEIKNRVLKGRKIDILGMDACLMAMLEIGYQIKDFARYMVGSQEVELATGWDYLSLIKMLLYGETPAEKLAKNIVGVYENYYKNRIKFYTQSAVDLENIGLLKDNVNQIVENFINCKKFDNNLMQKILKDSRREAIQFSNRVYIDLHSFYKKFSEKLESKFIDNKFSNLEDRRYSRLSGSQKQYFRKFLLELRDSLVLGMRLIEHVVIAKTAGRNFDSAWGLSAYFPMNGRMDISYAKTAFAQHSRWPELVLNSV